MDSFERSVQMSTEVKLNGDSIELDVKKENPQDLRVLALQKAKLQNGFDDRFGHVRFDDLKEGEFGELQSSFEKLQLKKSKYR